MTVFEAVQAEVDALPPALRNTPDAVLCLELASKLNGATPRDTATVSKELRLALAGLREAVKASGKRGDRVDELRARRATRAAAHPGGPAVDAK